MQAKALACSSLSLLPNPNHSLLSRSPTKTHGLHSSQYSSSNLRISLPETHRCRRLVPSCGNSVPEVLAQEPEIVNEMDGEVASVAALGEETEVVLEVKKEELLNQSIFDQIKEILMFSGPATGIWVMGPLMSLIDTAVIGQGSSIELAALGPGTILCDHMSHMFMFLSIATSNLVATALARQGKKEVQHQISTLLFVGLSSGILMLLFTKFLGSWALAALTGSKNAHIVPAASTYVQVRGLAWPAVLVGCVAQSASLGMKDSWGPLKALAVATAINGTGDIIFCSLLGYGIAGAAWATMVSQVVSSYMMIASLNNKGYDAFSISVPSANDLLTIFGLAAPVFVKTMSKVAFYSLMTYVATSMSTVSVAAHQVMIQIYIMCVVWGEPLSQTAQSFMPEFIYGVNRSLPKARMLLKSLLIIGAILGSTLGTIGTVVPWLLPKIFTHDPKVIQEMHKVLVPYFIALSMTPCTHSLEGTLLAGRELKFLSFVFSGCFSVGALLLLFVSNRGYGLAGCWWALVAFQCGRFFLALQRLLSPNGILHSEDLSRYNLGKLKAA